MNLISDILNDPNSKLVLAILCVGAVLSGASVVLEKLGKIGIIKADSKAAQVISKVIEVVSKVVDFVSANRKH